MIVGSSCPEGSVTVVSDVNNSSLQLVEMCRRRVWSPVCDNNWTLQDATVVCKEIGQGKSLRWYIIMSSCFSSAITDDTEC